MNRFKHFAFIFIVSLMIVCPSPLQAMRSSLQWRMESVSVSRYHQDSLLVNVTVKVVDDAVASRRAVVLQPFVIVDTQTFYLTPASFYRLDAKGRKYSVRKDSPFASGYSDEKEFICGMAKRTISFDGLFPMPRKAYSDTIRIYSAVTERRLPDKYEIAEVRKLACFVRKPEPVFEPVLYTVPVTDFDDSAVRTLVLPIDVEFEQGSVKFNEKYNYNERGVFEFRTQLGLVLGNPLVKVQSIQLDGYTDILGSFNQNTRNCQARVRSLYDYLRKDGIFKKFKVKQNALGEDWDYLKEWIKDSYWINNSEVSSILFGSYGKDSKEAMFKKNIPIFWDNMVRQLFPEMNRIVCRVSYSMEPLESIVDKCMQFNSDPSLLTPKDFSDIIENSSMFSTRWYDYVFGFYQCYPDCREACIYSAVAMLSLKDYIPMGGIIRQLEGFSDADSRYYVALWNIYKGNVVEGAEMLRKIQGKHYAHDSALKMIDSVIEWEKTPEQWERVGD